MKKLICLSLLAAAAAAFQVGVGGGIAQRPVVYTLWTPPGSCGVQFANCVGSAPWTPSAKITFTSWTLFALTAPAGCTTNGAYTLKQASTVLATIAFANGTSTYTASGFPINVDPANGALQMVTSATAAAGCSTNAATILNTLEYRMQ
jgi:hypothetical protein